MLNIRNKKYSPTGKRFDMDVVVRQFFGSEWAFSLRLLSREVVPEKDIKRLVNEVVKRKKEWKERPNYPSSWTLSLGEKGITAIVNPDVKKVNSVVENKQKDIVKERPENEGND